MKKALYQNLFRPLKLNGLRLKNRIIMAPLYLGYAHLGGKVSPLMLAHYRLMAQSRAALIVVENASITPNGSGSPRTLRCDHDRYLRGLKRLAQTINREKALAALQINHAGRFGHVAQPVAPSAVPAFGKVPRPLTKREITAIQKQYAKAALRVQKAGFDMVELHGGTGYLLAQFVSPRTNKRIDAYGGPIGNRIKFPLEVLKRVKDMVGNFPVGYRFLADEWLPDGLRVRESRVLARALEENGVAYISVMGGTYESFFLPKVIKESRRPGYMVYLASIIKKEVNVPVITAGRISTPALADSILKGNDADLIGLARMLWVDPEWVKKAREGRDRSILKCSPKCNACFQLVMQGKPAFCPRWKKHKRIEYQALFR
ncbi:MAG: NADH:flavin oxidoreductase [Deltaproteobacteria bacterium]|nr:MAG: NADH:flavin oxidoreductase [Deltaproteobacteria bacterium]